jgi:hypothetical protein
MEGESSLTLVFFYNMGGGKCIYESGMEKTYGASRYGANWNTRDDDGLGWFWWVGGCIVCMSVVEKT